MCPIFTPTLEEFTKYSFVEYLNAAEEMLGSNIGVYKVGVFKFTRIFNICGVVGGSSTRLGPKRCILREV